MFCRILNCAPTYTACLPAYVLRSSLHRWWYYFKIFLPTLHVTISPFPVLRYTDSLEYFDTFPLFVNFPLSMKFCTVAVCRFSPSIRYSRKQTPKTQYNGNAGHPKTEYFSLFAPIGSSLTSSLLFLTVTPTMRHRIYYSI